MKYTTVAFASFFLASASASGVLPSPADGLTKPVQGLTGSLPAPNGLRGRNDAAEPITNGLGINLKTDVGLNVGPAEENANDGGINVDLLGTNINAKVCLGVEIPSLISALVDIGCPSSPPPTDDRTHVWHPSHPGVYIDDCDDDEATGWHYVHQGQPKNTDQGHYVWAATAGPAATHTVVQGGNQYTSVEIAESTTVCAVPAPSGYVPPATAVYVPLTPAVPAPTSTYVAPVVPAYTQGWETHVRVPAVPTATPASGHGSGAPWYGSGSGSGSGAGYASPSDSGSGAAAGTPAAGVCPGPNCPPGASTVVIPVIPVPSGTHEGPASETPGVPSTPVVAAGASRNVGGLFAIILAVAALL